TVPTNVTIDSQSILPAVLTGTNLVRYAYVEKFGTNTPTEDRRALRSVQYKLIQFTNDVEEFYDLDADPYEGTNLLTKVLTAAQQSSYFALEMRLGLYQTALAAPTIASSSAMGNVFTVTVAKGTNVTYGLWRSSTLETLGWAPVTNAVVSTNGARVQLVDPAPPQQAF